MICPNCKTELEDGLIHCPICNTPLQMVPDYNSLDDEIPHVEGGEKLKQSKQPVRKRKRIPKRIIILILALFAIFALVWYLYVCCMCFG